VRSGRHGQDGELQGEQQQQRTRQQRPGHCPAALLAREARAWVCEQTWMSWGSKMGCI
jgi:hypothetical protein